jgi:hypothetical protein
MAEQGAAPTDLAQAFIRFSLESGVLRFGEFKTKAGRLSPYFFNAGLFDDGAKLARLAHFYAQLLINSDMEFDMVFGPAYKGIPLGAVVAAELARLGRNVPFAYNRKEAKDHGEGGTLVGAPLKGRVLTGAYLAKSLFLLPRYSWLSLMRVTGGLLRMDTSSLSMASSWRACPMKSLYTTPFCRLQLSHVAPHKDLSNCSPK